MPELGTKAPTTNWMTTLPEPQPPQIQEESPRLRVMQHDPQRKLGCTINPYEHHHENASVLLTDQHPSNNNFDSDPTERNKDGKK